MELSCIAILFSSLIPQLIRLQSNMRYISAAILVFASTSSAWLLPQANNANSNNQGQSGEALSYYPQGTDLNQFNGTWYLTGVTKNAWDVYQTLSQKYNIQVDCAHFDVNTTSNTTLDVLSSAFLNQTTLNFGFTATVAGSLILQQPDQKTNVSNHELLWKAYTSQVFVNKGLWNKLIQNEHNTNNDNATTGSTPVPGTKPVEATIYTQLIDTTAQPGTNTSTNFDAVFVWGSQAKVLDSGDGNNHHSRRDDHDDIYGVLLTKNTTLSPDVFNRTAGLLPQAAVINNAQLIQLNDTCSNNNGQQGQGQQSDPQQPNPQQPEQQQPGQQQAAAEQPGYQPFLGH